VVDVHFSGIYKAFGKLPSGFIGID